MAFTTNRPTIERLQRQLQVSAVEGELGLDVAKIDPDLLEDFLEDAITLVEGEAHTSFDGRAHSERRDGNGTNGLSLLRWPIGRVSEVKVDLPVLALTRTYTNTVPPSSADEVKVYRFQGRLTIFTYKLATEHVSLHLDQQVYGNILPPLPQCVHVSYSYGFPQFDAAANAGVGATTFDGGLTSEVGDQRDALDRQHLRRLQSAAIADAAGAYLAQCAGLSVGVLQSVSFDGFSKTLNPQAYATQAQALRDRRDELLAKAKRGFYLASTG